ncbi:post-embryonic retina morphogenesis in camera-type eye [Mactra antiquata]
MIGMNYSVFKVQNHAGKPGIFWEKESIPKNDRKFGYKKKEQRFPIRRYPGDKHHVESDLVSLTPDEPPPPPKPAKNFIKRNKQKVTTNKKEPASTVTLTQDQLNAILKSVGKVAGGSENAIKISIDKNNETKEITVESPRRYEHDDEDDDYDDRKERRRKKKPERNEEEGSSIYSLIGGKKTKASSETESGFSDDASIELRRVTKHYKNRKGKKSRNDLEDEIANYNRELNKKSKHDIDNDDNIRSRKSRSKSKEKPSELEKEMEEIRKNKARLTELEREIEELRIKNQVKYDDDNSDIERDTKVRRGRSKRQELDNDDIDLRDYDRGRTRKNEKSSRKEEHSKERRGRKTRKESEEREENLRNDSLNKEDDELIPSPRDKIGLPIDLSWRHMTKAERRRLEAARQRAVDEEERKEEERIKDLNSRYAPDESRKISPQRHKPPRSDPVTRLDRGRETEISNYTENNNRRGRRSPSPSEQRSIERSPDLPSYTTPDTSPKGPIGIPKRHMTLAEKKRLEWEKERVESVQLEQVGKFDPWGRPGAGAPLRSRSGHVMADYKGRQEHMHGQTIPEEEGGSGDKHVDDGRQERKQAPRGRSPSQPSRGRSPPPAAPQSEINQPPITMRSSFALGQAVPDMDRFESAKERERKQWLADLEKQIEEKRQLEMKKLEPVEKDTWADKFGSSYRPAPFPEQAKDTTATAAIDPFNTSSDQTAGGGTLALESNRVQSAPDLNSDDPQSFIRGQNAPIDPVTKKELEDKRQRYLDHQAAVKAQVEEKERLKKLERERKMKEDMEEERKLQKEREMLQKQFESEQVKLRQKEQQRQAQVNQLKAAMDEAQAKALQEKYQRKMQHLEAGGHDTTKLREHLEAKITPREDGVSVGDHSHVPGLDLSTVRTQNVPVMPTTRRDLAQYSQHQGQTSQGQGYSIQGHHHEPYTEDRILTPSRFRHPSKPYSDPGSPRREFGTQTGKLNDSGSDVDGDDITRLLNPRLARDDSEVEIIYRYERGKKVRVISAPKEAVAKRTKKPQHVPHPPPSYREQSSPHEHHHVVRNRKEIEEQKRKKKLELQRRKGPVKPGSRPMWGYKNADNKKPVKQSERDPFYEQRKQENEERRIKREQKLLAMVEANKPVIPDYYVPPAQRSSRSRSRSRDRSPFSDIEMASPRQVQPGRRSKSHSPGRDHHQHYHHHHGDGDYYNENDNSTKRRHQSRSPTHRNSPHVERTVENRPSRGKQSSPPVPALRHRNDADGESKPKHGGKYDDVDPVEVPLQNGDFVPFTRTIDVLDPSKAEEPLPLSREATRVANARRAYFESLHPEKFGNKQYVFQDKHRVLPGNDETGKNPIMNPSLVLDHPTNRQDQILVQLSTLKQSLMQRQRELETFSPTDLVRMDTDIRA